MAPCLMATHWWHVRVQLCSILCDPMDCSPPGSSIHGIFQAIILEWVTFSFSRGSSRSMDPTHVSRVSCMSRHVLYHWTTWEACLMGTGFGFARLQSSGALWHNRVNVLNCALEISWDGKFYAIWFLPQF